MRLQCFIGSGAVRLQGIILFPLSLSLSILDITLCLFRTFCKAVQSRLFMTGLHPESQILHESMEMAT